MSLVCLLYALVALQGFIVILHFTGKGYIISLIFELTFLSFRVLMSFSQSAFRWVLPPRKSLHGELALVTGAASGIGRLISLRLAEKGWLFFFKLLLLLMFVLKVKSKLNCHDLFSVCGLAAHKAFVL